MHYEEFRLGRRFTGPSRHLDADAVTGFADLTGDRSALHLEEGLTPDGRPLVHGALVVAGFYGWLHAGGLGEQHEAALDLHWSYRAPVYTGESVTYEMTVVRSRRASSGRSGVINRHVLVRNQDGDVVSEGRSAALVRAREARDATDQEAGAEFPTVRWARLLAERLNVSPSFTGATGTWDGTIGLRFTDDVVLFRIYRGRVLEAGTRVPNGPTFVLGASDLTWTGLLTGPDNDFMARTMRGEFSTSGDAYEYVRLTAAVVALIDEARELARESGADLADATSNGARPGAATSDGAGTGAAVPDRLVVGDCADGEMPDRPESGAAADHAEIAADGTPLVEQAGPRAVRTGGPRAIGGPWAGATTVPGASPGEAAVAGARPGEAGPDGARPGEMRARYLEIGGAGAFVLDDGPVDGQPLFCLHTAGQNGVQWRHAQPALAALGYRVIVPDLPGHGRSEPVPGGPVRDLGVYAGWCEELMDRLGLDRPFVVGCSIGGAIALHLAVRRGDRLPGVVAMAAHGGGEREILSVRGLERELVDAASPSRSDRAHLGTLAVVGSSVPTRTRELIARMHRREDPDVTNSDLIGWVTHRVVDELPAVACPVHLVVGADDLWLDPAAVQRSADLIPDGTCHVLEGIGHYPMEEIDRFPEVLHGWLTGLKERA